MNRYNSYRDSEVVWIDEIPSHWIKSKFKYESSKLVQYGLNTNSEQYVEKGVRFLRTTDINDFGVISNDGVYIEEDNIPQNYILEKFDFLISRSGTLGRSYLHLSDNLFSFAGYLVRFNFENLTKSKFVFYFTKSKNFFDWISLNTIQSTIGNVNGEKYSNLDIIIPPFHEQEQIVAYLDKKTSIVDTLITSKEEKINLLKEKRTALISHVITKGLDPKVKLKDSGVEWIGEIPEHWVMKKMKYIFQIQKRISGELGYDVLSITQKGIKIKDIESGKGQVSMDYTKYQIVEIGDFAMNHMDLLTGYIDISPYKGVTSPDYRVFSQIDNNINSKFYLYLFQFGYTNKVFYGFGQGSSMFGRWRLPSLEFNNFKLPYPSIEEQNEIVNYLEEQFSQLEQSILIEQKKIDTLKEYRQALISEVVTGKIKVVKD